LIRSPTMSRNFRLELVGKKVLRVERDGEGMGLQFSEDWNLAIWARSRLITPDGDEWPAGDVSILVGTRLHTFAGDDAFERLTFENGCAIVVDLRAAPGSVAESMALYCPDSTTVIWE